MIKICKSESVVMLSNTANKMIVKSIPAEN